MSADAERWIAHIAWIGKHDDPCAVASEAGGLLRAVLDDNVRLRGAMEQAVTTCSVCHGTGFIYDDVTPMESRTEVVLDLPYVSTDTLATLAAEHAARHFAAQRADPPTSRTLAQLDCPRCIKWRDLLAQKVDHA